VGNLLEVPHTPPRSRARSLPVNDSDLSRRNLRFGWALFGLFVLLFAGTFLVALLYLQLD